MKTLSWSFLLLSLALGGCREVPSGPTPIASLPRALDVAETQLVQANNRFAFKLLQEISREQSESNVFISPLSVAMALAMTYNGAAGPTRDSMALALELRGLTVDQVDASYRTLIDLLRGLDPGVQYTLANSIWYRRGLSV